MKETPEIHLCLLCPCQIPPDWIYCSSCGTEVWATKGNADHGGVWKEKWEKLWARIQKAKKERI